jgi:hypothetical protein
MMFCFGCLDNTQHSQEKGDNFHRGVLFVMSCCATSVVVSMWERGEALE